MEHIYDLIIVGGGAGGLSAAIYAGRAGRDALLIEKGSYGGRVNDTTEIRNYPGTPSDSGRGLMEKFKAHAEGYPTLSFLRTTVTGLSRTEEGFTVSTRRRGDLTARSVILDLGTRPRKLGIPGEEEFSGHGVAYCATCDAEFYKDREVYVLGAGDQAVEEACYLTGFAAKITIIVLHEEGRLDCNEQAAQRAFADPKISFLWDTTLEELKGDGRVESIVLKNVVTGARQEMRADGVFFFVGMVPQTEPVRDLVACDRDGYILVDEKRQTSLPGLYAVGDCTHTFLRQVVTAAADGAVAEVASERYVTEARQLHDLLGPDSGRVAVLFYDPYQTGQLDAVTRREEELRGAWKVVRQDVSRQDLLYRRLGMAGTPSAAFYEHGDLIEKKED